jgi:hypothetical protein
MQQVTVSLQRGPAGFGVRLTKLDDAAYIEGVQDAAEGADLICGDRIVKVESQDVLNYNAAFEAIKASGAMLELTVVRDPKAVLRLKGRQGKLMGNWVVIMLLVAVMAIRVDWGSLTKTWLPEASRLYASMDPAAMATNDDGTARQPYAFAARLRLQAESMERMRREKPEWAAVVDADVLDVPKFREIRAIRTAANAASTAYPACHQRPC